MKIQTDIHWNIAHFKQKLNCAENFDIVYRNIQFCNKQGCLFFIDGFIKDDIIEKILEHFYRLSHCNQVSNAHDFAQQCVPYCEVTINDQIPSIVTSILSGVIVLFVDGFTHCIQIDARTYPQRGISEPDKDKVFRGSKDGFVEILVLNCALIRRRIRDIDLCIEYLQVGDSSKTDVALCYMKQRCDKQLLHNIKNKLQQSHVPALTMNQESLAEVLLKNKWYNPFPKFKYTERPDTTAAQILEGDIVILVDNSPSAMILPVNLFDIMEEANDYYFPPITGTYLRLTRFLFTFATMFITPIWLLLLQNPNWIPWWLQFIQLKETANIPVIAQLLILEFAIDGLKLASLSTPNMLTTSLSMIGALVLSDFAVQTGWINVDTMLYMAFVALANYSQPGYELGYAIKFMRMLLLIAIACFNWMGFALGMIAIFIFLLSNKTISGKSYLYPLIPFHLKDFKKKILRIKMD